MKPFFFICFGILLMFSCAVTEPTINNYEITKVQGISIPLSWFTDLKGDYSFASKWEFSRDIKINDFNQIICEPCSPRTSKMLDRRQKIIADSMVVFYKEIDSSKHYYSLESRCTAENWEETNFISVRKYGDFIIEGNVLNNENNSFSLFFRIKNDFVTSWIYCKSENGESSILSLKEGKFFIDKIAFDKGILKAKFSFVYNNPKNSLKALYWSGKMYSKIASI